jgi:predicted transglutaminase-like protease
MVRKIKSRISEIKSSIDYKFACWLGYCPTKKEIENSEIKDLANRLKSKSVKETLTNILDWEGKNIEFWTERHPIVSIFTHFITWITISPLFVLAGLIVALSLIFGLFDITALVTWFTALWITILITGICLILIIITQIIHSNRKISRFKGLVNVLSNSMSIHFLLENKLGICRDYAKLTACLLVNIYPTAEIYFAHAPNHVATGMLVDNRLYMLDQRLPILTINKWDKYRNLKGKLSKLERNKIRLVDSKILFSQTKDEPLDTQKLAITVTRFLNLKEQTGTDSNFNVKVKLRKGAMLYQDDEMVNYSLARWLRAKITMELIDLNPITKIEVINEKDDLLFLIHLRLA